MREEAIEARPRRWRWESLTGGAVLFQEDGFRRLWLGRVLSHTALNAVLFTLLILAVGEGSGSSIKSALFITAYLLPTATLGTISGVLVDWRSGGGGAAPRAGTAARSPCSEPAGSESRSFARAEQARRARAPRTFVNVRER